jgi:hypothetical protein
MEHKMCFNDELFFWVGVKQGIFKLKNTSKL